MIFQWGKFRCGAPEPLLPEIRVSFSSRLDSLWRSLPAHRKPPAAAGPRPEAGVSSSPAHRPGARGLQGRYSGAARPLGVLRTEAREPVRPGPGLRTCRSPFPRRRGDAAEPAAEGPLRERASSRARHGACRSRALGPQPRSARPAGEAAALLPLVKTELEGLPRERQRGLGYPSLGGGTSSQTSGYLLHSRPAVGREGRVIICLGIWCSYFLAGLHSRPFWATS